MATETERVVIDPAVIPMHDLVLREATKIVLQGLGLGAGQHECAEKIATETLGALDGEKDYDMLLETYSRAIVHLALAYEKLKPGTAKACAEEFHAQHCTNPACQVGQSGG